MITTAFCNSYKSEILRGVHQENDTYQIALYTESATLSKSTAQYSGAGEVSEGNGYTPGGRALSGFQVVMDGDTAILDWTVDPTWAPSSIVARGALIYNSTRENRAVAVLDFGSEITSTNEVFRVTLPMPSATHGLIRIS